MPGRLEFGTSNIQSPLAGLQSTVASIGDTFSKYMANEEARADRLAREAREEKRYDTQMARYDAQEQESKRRYEEGKLLHEKEYAEATRLRNAQEARAEADHKYSTEQRTKAAKLETDNRLVNSTLPEIVSGAVANTDMYRDVTGRIASKADAETEALRKADTTAFGFDVGAYNKADPTKLTEENKTRLAKSLLTEGDRDQMVTSLLQNPTVAASGYGNAGKLTALLGEQNIGKDYTSLKLARQKANEELALQSAKETLKTLRGGNDVEGTDSEGNEVTIDGATKAPKFKEYTDADVEKAIKSNPGIASSGRGKGLLGVLADTEVENTQQDIDDARVALTGKNSRITASDINAAIVKDPGLLSQYTASKGLFKNSESAMIGVLEQAALEQANIREGRSRSNGKADLPDLLTLRNKSLEELSKANNPYGDSATSLAAQVGGTGADVLNAAGYGAKSKLAVTGSVQPSVAGGAPEDKGNPLPTPEQLALQQVVGGRIKDVMDKFGGAEAISRLNPEGQKAYKEAVKKELGDAAKTATENQIRGLKAASSNLPVNTSTYGNIDIASATPEEKETAKRLVKDGSDYQTELDKLVKGRLYNTYMGTIGNTLLAPAALGSGTAALTGAVGSGGMEWLMDDNPTALSVGTAALGGLLAGKYAGPMVQFQKEATPVTTNVISRHIPTVHSNPVPTKQQLQLMLEEKRLADIAAKEASVARRARIGALGNTPAPIGALAP